MGASAKLFLENSEQLITMYEPNFHKKRRNPHWQANGR
jgi:hypothetical protein